MGTSSCGLHVLQYHARACEVCQTAKLQGLACVHARVYATGTRFVGSISKQGKPAAGLLFNGYTERVGQHLEIGRGYLGVDDPCVLALATKYGVEPFVSPYYRVQSFPFIEMSVASWSLIHT